MGHNHKRSIYRQLTIQQILDNSTHINSMKSLNKKRHLESEQMNANPKDVKEKPIVLEKKLEEEKPKSSTSHSAIGITLVLGFVFMLIIDHIGGKISHGHPHQSIHQF